MPESMSSESTGVVSLTIANGATESDAFDARAFRLFSFIFGTMTGTSMSFLTAPTLGGTYVPVYDGAGALVSMTIASDECISNADATAALAPLRFVKVKSGSAEGAARTVQVVARR